MTVYAIAQFEYTDKDAYDRYTAQFWDVFKNYRGRLLVSDENPEILEGEWNKSKLVLMAFPDRDAFMEWASSPAYLEIAKDRKAGARGSVILSQELDITQPA